MMCALCAAAALQFPGRVTNQSVDGNTIQGIFASDLTLAEVKTL
jgi:hypothetical protein